MSYHPDPEAEERLQRAFDETAAQLAQREAEDRDAEQRADMVCQQALAARGGAQ